MDTAMVSDEMKQEMFWIIVQEAGHLACYKEHCKHFIRRTEIEGLVD